MFGHDVHDEVDLLPSLVGTISALELRLFPALPPGMIVQGALPLVGASAFFASEFVLLFGEDFLCRKGKHG